MSFLLHPANQKRLRAPEMGAMDELGHRAMTYARVNCPRRYAGLEDPEAFFHQLGEQMRLQVTELEDQLTPPAKPGEEWVTQAGRLQTGRYLAEQTVFSEMVLQAWPAEPHLETEEDEDPAPAWINLNPPLAPDEGGPEEG